VRIVAVAWSPYWKKSLAPMSIVTKTISPRCEFRNSPALGQLGPGWKAAVRGAEDHCQRRLAATAQLDEPKLSL
jgi:hypothetical protein